MRLNLRTDHAVGRCRLLLALLLSALSILAGADEPRYVGWKACEMCHKDETADWLRSKHGKAFELLKPGNRHKAKKNAKLDPDKDYTVSTEKCVGCHTTGFKKPGGFVDTTTTPEMVGIQCEACHGPGSEYRTIHKSKRTEFKRDEVKAVGQTYGSENDQVCRNCHEHKDTPMQPSIDEKYKFDWKERLKDARAFHRRYDVLKDHR